MVDMTRLLDELRDATPAECGDVVLLAASIAAHKRCSTPRDILDGCWKAISDERYRQSMLPALELVTAPL